MVHDEWRDQVERVRYAVDALLFLLVMLLLITAAFVLLICSSVEFLAGVWYDARVRYEAKQRIT